MSPRNPAANRVAIALTDSERLIVVEALEILEKKYNGIADLFFNRTPEDAGAIRDKWNRVNALMNMVRNSDQVTVRVQA